MRNDLVLCALLGAIPCAASYNYTGSNYVTPFACTRPCATGAGTCANHTTSMHVTGSFTVNTALPVGVTNSDITSLLASFSFSDGLGTFASTDPKVRVLSFRVTTNSAGRLVNVSFQIMKWTSGALPHVAGSRLDFVSGGEGKVAYHNAYCSMPAGSDACGDAGFELDSSTSRVSYASGSWADTAATPTLSEWGLLALAGLMGAYGWRLIRREASC